MKTPDPEKRWSNVGRLLLLAFDGFERRVVAAIRAAGFEDFTMSHGSALRNIDLEGTRISEVARRAHMTKQGMGLLIQELEARGYVARTSDPTDGRAKIVRFTPRGLALIVAGQDAYEELARDWRREIGNEAFARLRKSLKDVIGYENRIRDQAGS